MKYNVIMKKMCCILLFFVFFDYQLFFVYKASAYENKTQYAKALSDCVLYKSSEMKDNYDDIYFYVPESYFVIVLEAVNDDCVKVQYDKYIGYVKFNTIVLSTFTPIVKTLEGVKFDIKETSGTQIWNKPSTSGSVLTTVPAGFKRISYISKTIGDIPYGGESNVWFYVTYIPFANSTNVYEGYIYSENSTNLDKIIFNSETNPEINEIENVSDNSSINLNATFRTIIVSLISIPIILFIVVILYKIVKKIKINTNKTIFHNVENEENFNGCENVNLKTKIDNMKNQVFIKQPKYDKNKNQYPTFPHYDSDDDLL